MIDIEKKYYHTGHGSIFHGQCEDLLSQYKSSSSFEPINLIFTSPPFPLNRAKKYGNMTGDEYLKWMSSLSVLFSSVLADDGSLVIEIGNAWVSGSPEQSTLPMEALLELKKAGEFHLCQEFIHFNPARLPAPIEWVNKKRIRVKDSFTRIWWLSKTAFPKANNKKVLDAYSSQMEKLIKSKKYNSGKRPSEYIIGESSFSKDNTVLAFTIEESYNAGTSQQMQKTCNDAFKVALAKWDLDLRLEVGFGIDSLGFTNFK